MHAIVHATTRREAYTRHRVDARIGGSQAIEGRDIKRGHNTNTILYLLTLEMDRFQVNNISLRLRVHMSYLQRQSGDITNTSCPAEPVVRIRGGYMS
jgi:hypothetical protein